MFTMVVSANCKCRHEARPVT